MSYNPTVWKNGDLITAEKLNKLENGLRDMELTPGPEGPQGPQGPPGPSGEMVDKLSGKLVLMMGDSLMQGGKWDGGFANCIKENHPTATVINLGKDGKHLIDGEIGAQIMEWRSQNSGVTPDIVIVNGGGNDFLDSKELGTPALDNTEPLNNSDTVCSALDTMFWYIFDRYPTTRIFFITGPLIAKIETIPAPEVQLQYYDALRKVCEKFGVPVIDLTKNAQIPPSVTTLCKKYYDTDPIHLNEAGYRRVSAYIENVLLSNL